MGFFDSLKKGYEEESQRSTERQERSTYKTLQQQKEDHFLKLNSQSDGELMRKYRSPLTSDEDKKTILSILKGRGYRVNQK